MFKFLKIWLKYQLYNVFVSLLFVNQTQAEGSRF